MSDIQKIDTSKSIDHGGLTVRHPFGEGEGRDAKISSQDIKTQADNLLNKFKPLRRFEAKTFSSLYSMMNDGTLGIYQSDLPYPGLSNFTLKTTIDLGIPAFSLNAQHYIFNYGNYQYVMCPDSNIKYLDSAFNIAEIDINNRFDSIFVKDTNTIFSVIDRTVYEIDLSNNTSSVYGTLDSSIIYPMSYILYDSINNKFVVIDGEETSDNIYVLDSSLNIIFTINMTSSYTGKIPTCIFDNKNGTILIILQNTNLESELLNLQLDLSDNSISEINASNIIYKKYYLDIFNKYSVQNDGTNSVIYDNSNTLVSFPVNKYQHILNINPVTDTIIVKQYDGKKCVYALSTITSSKPQKILELD